MRAAVVARDGELERVRRGLARGPGVLLAGEVGVGKTALASAVTPAGHPPSAWIVATAAARLTPFGALAPLLPPNLGGVHPALIPQVVAGRLAELAGARPLLVVDDAQLLDDHSAAALLTIVRSGSARVLATVRTGVPTSDAVRALWKDGLLDRVDLGPLDRAGVRLLLAARLGDEPATTTVELLWRHSQGNPLYLTELIRFGLDTGRLRTDAGVWWWSGGAQVPPRLDELLGHRLDGLSPAGQEAVDLLALGEPLPYDTLAALVPADALAELDEGALVTSDDHDGVVRLRFAHPLVHAVAEHRLGSARRRHLAGRLRLAPAEHVDLVRRAAWEEAAAGPAPDVSLLLAAADQVLVSEAHTAVRFASRAARHDPGPGAAVALSAAYAELGRRTEARAALASAARRVRDDGERLAVGFEEISLSMWSDRDPAGAGAALARLRAAVPGQVDELDSAGALTTMFTARPAEALRAADAVLAGRPGHSARVRALTVRIAALTLDDRPDESVSATAELLAVLRERPVRATRNGLAHAIAALAYQFSLPTVTSPARAHGLSGRWPSVPVPEQPATEAAGPAWPLLEGVRRHLEGDWPAALAALREAHLQQQTGEGLFRSEAAAGLIVVLAESGRVDEADRLLAEHPPDGVAVVPGLAAWARAAVAAAAGHTTAAIELALAAARETVAAGATTTALWYLADAARYGAAREALAELARLPRPPRSPIARARAANIEARATGRADPLLRAAEQHLAAGLFGHARELAELAERAGGQGGNRPARAKAVIRQSRGSAGATGPDPAAVAAGLTRRELETARMAAGGMTDREIADALVVSVRTVESHLASAYRKLGIGSRRALAAALGRPPP